MLLKSLNVILIFKEAYHFFINYMNCFNRVSEWDKHLEYCGSNGYVKE